MEFTILGIIWLFICLYGLIFWKIEKIISLLLLSCIFQCSPVIKLQGTNAIIPMLVASLFVILKSLIITVSSRSVIKFSKKQALPLLAFLAVIWLSFICTVIFSGIPVMEDTDFRTVANIKIIYYELSVSWGQVLKITKATVYILCYLCILDAVQKGLVHREAIEKTIIQAMWIVVAIGLIQYVSRLLGIRSVVLERLVYTDPVAEYYWKYTGRLYSTF